MFLGLASSCAAQQAVAPEPSVEAVYRFKLDGKPVEKGEVWLYYHVWHSAWHFQLCEVTHGTARVRLSPARYREEDDYLNDSYRFIAALHIPGVGWYRTPDFTAALTNLLPMLDSLGRSKVMGGVHVVDLPDPVKQVLHIQNPDGSTRAGMEFTVEPFGETENHCGVHVGFEGPDAVRTLTTDGNGTASFTAPPADLYLEVYYYEEGRNALGRTLTGRRGLRLPAAREHIVRQAWDMAPPKPFRITIVRPDGTPGRAMFMAKYQFIGCGSSERILGTSGPDGVIVDTIAFEHFEGFWIADDDGSEERHILSEIEMLRLIETGELTVPRP